MKFKEGDKLLCIVDFKSFLELNKIYTYKEYSSEFNEQIFIVEDNNPWFEYRFIKWQDCLLAKKLYGVL